MILRSKFAYFTYLITPILSESVLALLSSNSLGNKLRISLEMPSSFAITSYSSSLLALALACTGSKSTNHDLKMACAMDSKSSIDVVVEFNHVIDTLTKYELLIFDLLSQVDLF